MAQEPETTGAQTETTSDDSTSAAPTNSKPDAKRAKRPTKTETARVARTYFEALGQRDRNAQLDWYGPDATVTFHGVTGPSTRDQMVEYFAQLFGAFPDFGFEILDLVAEGDRAAVRWRLTGTFAGTNPYMGIEPNGARVAIEGVDYVWVRDGKIQRIEAYTDGTTVARQLGMLPPQDSSAERRMTAAFNAKTRLERRFAGGEAEPVADGVWLLRGGFPQKTMNVYLIADGDGVMLFDAGIRQMTRTLATAGLALGGITRILLGHGHVDHRGAAPGLGVPVLCHPDAREDAETDGGIRYADFSKLRRRLSRWAYPRLLRMWDGGPVQIADTVDEGDEIAGFRVVDISGHAPGMIALWRESDRLALTTDGFYTVDPESGRKGPPRVPLAAFNLDTEQARASVRKIAALEPAAAWPGHADPVTGDVRDQLERAADTT